MERNPRTTLGAHSYSFLDHWTSGIAEREAQSTDDRSLFFVKGRWWGGQATRTKSTDCLRSHCVRVTHSLGWVGWDRRNRSRSFQKQTLRKQAQNTVYLSSPSQEYGSEKYSACNHKIGNQNQVRLGRRHSPAIHIGLRKQITSQEKSRGSAMPACV